MQLQSHTCAIVGLSGGLLCWGWNGNGQVQGCFVEGWRGYAAKVGGWVCDVVVTPCDVRRLEMVLARPDALLLLCLGWAPELSW